MSKCQHEYGAARCKFCGARKPTTPSGYSSPRPYGPWVPAPEPEAPSFCDGTEGEWCRAFTVRSLLTDPEYGPAFPRSALGYLGRERNEVTWLTTGSDGTVQAHRAIEPVGERKPFPRAPMGKLDPDWLDMDMSVVEYFADEYDYVTTRDGKRRVSEFDDMLAQMGEVTDVVGDDGEVVRNRKWNRDRVEHADGTSEWVDAYWSRQELADRLSRYVWNEDFFKARKIPFHARAGRILVDGTGRFVYLGDSVFCTVVVRWFDRMDERTNKPIWKFTVYWRESMGFDEKRHRVWNYLYAKSFTSEAGTTDMAGFHREGAVGFAQRLEAKARLEAELILDDRRSMGQLVTPEWDRDEFPYDPGVMAFLGDRGGWSDED